jgi:hypothetical protein
LIGGLTRQLLARRVKYTPPGECRCPNLVKQGSSI